MRALLVPTLLLLSACASNPGNRAPAPLTETAPRSSPVIGTAQAAPVAEDFEVWQHDELTPVLNASDLVHASLLRGPFHELNPRVPINWGMAVFTLHTAFGRMQVESVDMLSIRIDELAAVDKLAAQTSLGTFAGSAGDAAMRTGEAMANVVTDPVGTIGGLPSGVARLIGRTYRSVRRSALDASDAARGLAASDEEQSSDENAEDDDAQNSGRSSGERAYGAAEGATLRYIGYNRARRDLALRLQVDPYTTNPWLNAQMDQLAWSGLVGRVGFSTLLGGAGALAEAASISGRLNRLVWELSPEEIRDLNERKLADGGFSGIRVRDFLRNRHFHPSLEIAFTDSLLALGEAQGRHELIELAADAEDEVEARFLVRLLQMAELTQSETGHAVTNVIIDRGYIWLLLAHQSSPVVLAPVDYLSLTPWLEQMLQHPELLGRRAQLRVAGLVSSAARSRLHDSGWSVDSLTPVNGASAYRQLR